MSPVYQNQAPAADTASEKPWKRVVVSEVCELIVDCVNKTAPVVEELTPYKMLRTTNIKGGRIDRENCRRVTKDTYQKWTRRAEVRRGDVILTREAPVGEVGYVDFDDTVFLGQRLMQYRAKPALLEPRFLHYAFLSKDLQNQFAAHDGSGSTISHIRVGDCSKFQINLPPLPEQKTIARILGTLDDKIELNRRMNATLEAMARALFQSWFVDFDPVHAKAAARQPSGMDPATAALFPASFQDSALGEIPSGWEVKPLSKLCTLGRGASPRPINDYMDGEVPWIKIADATGAGGPFLFETKEKVKKAGAEKSVAVVPGDLIPSNSATCGVPIFVEFHGCIHDGWLYFKNLHSISKLYLFHLLIELAEHLIHIADGSVQKNLNTNLVGQQNVLVPPPAIVTAFDAQVAPWFARIRQNTLESRTLATLRDTLLPKLLSGVLPVE